MKGNPHGVTAMTKLDRNVPPLNSLPVVQRVRRQASGAADALTVTRDAVRGDQTDGVVGMSD